MAWRFLEQINFIDRGLVNTVKCSANALDGWNGSDEVYNINYADIIQLGNAKVGRDIGSQSYGLHGSHDTWIHFYNEGNDWYYRALVIYKNGSDVVHYTQLTQSYDLEFYYGIGINDDTGRAALIQVTVNKNSGDYTAATAWFYASGTFDFNDFYGAFRCGDQYYSSSGAGAGSGYIGNSLLSNKKMVGYNVPTSSAEGTKTESVNDVSASAVSGKPKSGNGFVRIKLIREVEQFRSISRPLGNRIMPAKFKPEYSYYYGRQEVPTGQQYYDIEGATPITLTRGGSDSVSFGDIPAYFGIYDPNSSNVVNWYVRKVNSSGSTMGSGAFSADGNYTFYIIAGGEPENPNGKGYFTVIRTTDWSNGWGGMVFSTEMLSQLRDYFT